MDFDTFFEALSFELKQSGPNDKNTSYEYLNFDQAKFYVNESIKEFVQLNPSAFEIEEEFTMLEDTSVYDLPKMYRSASNYKSRFDGLWYSISDSSDRLAEVKTVGERKLIFNPKILKGDSITLFVVKYPPTIESGSDSVVFPEQFMRLLRLHIVKKATRRKGKDFPYADEYQLYMSEFMAYNKPIENTSFMNFRGYGFGR